MINEQKLFSKINHTMQSCGCTGNQLTKVDDDLEWYQPECYVEPNNTGGFKVRFNGDRTNAIEINSSSYNYNWRTHFFDRTASIRGNYFHPNSGNKMNWDTYSILVDNKNTQALITRLNRTFATTNKSVTPLKQ